jgi:hypothetical protein
MGRAEGDPSAKGSAAGVGASTLGRGGFPTLGPIGMGAAPAHGGMGTAAALAAAALTAYAATAAVVPLVNNDIWIHLTTGGLILDEGAVPQVDRYSFTAAGNRYVPHEWLAAVLYATAERAAGLPGVHVVAKVLPTFAIAATLLAAVAATRAPWGLALPVLVLALTVLRYRVLARPELLALPLLLATVALLWRDRCAAGEGRRTRALYALVPLEVLWVNLHGSFPLGIALVGVFAAADLAQRTLAPRDVRARRARAAGIAVALLAAAWLAHLEPRAFGLPAAVGVVAVAALFAIDGYRPIFDDDAPTGQGPLRLLGLAAAMTGAAALNPLGVSIYAFPFEFTAGDNVITSLVNEWKPLLGTHHLDGSLCLASYGSFLALGCGALAIAAWRRCLGRLELGLLLAFGVLPFRHVRWMALFALVASPAVVALLNTARTSTRRPDGVSRVTGLALAAGGLACLGLTAARADGAFSDPPLLAAWLVASAASAVALALAAWPRLSPRWGHGVAGVAALGLVALAAVPGIPEVAGLAPRPWVGAGVGPGYGPSRQAMPAIEYLREAGIGGRLLTEYEWAGYAIHRLWPRVTVFIDSRSEVYGEAMLAEFRRIKGREDAARDALERHAVDLVLVSRQPFPAASTRNPGLLRAVEGDPAWGLLYLDDRSVLYARRVPARGLRFLFERFPPAGFGTGAPNLDDPAFEAEVRAAVARAPQSAFLRFALASALRAQGRPQEALAELGAAWSANPEYAAAPQLAGEIAAANGNRRLARRWFERAAEAAPGWSRPRLALRSLAGSGE